MRLKNVSSCSHFRASKWCGELSSSRCDSDVIDVYVDNEHRRTNFIVVFGRNRPDYIYLIGLIWNSMETLVHKAGCWQISVV
jgi:hypothetical protein